MFNIVYIKKIIIQLRATDHTYKQIEEITGCSYTFIYQYLNKKESKERVKFFQDNPFVKVSEVMKRNLIEGMVYREHDDTFKKLKEKNRQELEDYERKLKEGIICT